ncbi:hypothetical protein KFK09_014446 [Dendrobium nobile]|uniref:Gamma-interferon-inducible lysosomal thiol reductase n=1 Tax=Dendrobium nobile TaxID=94219 RepID=A0A8T3B351_DENNO|nr:hypothetical protein KFK09_014446 [Dendrobium nobile]
MASVNQALFFFFFFFVLSSSIFLPFSTIWATQKVSLALYYEALCPFCSRFIVFSLSKIFSDGLISIVDLRLVPYGNAMIGPNSTILCQHGPSECFLNTVEACAINSWPDVQRHFSFIYCVENLVFENKYNDWESCFQKTAQTNALQPSHRYVPWVVVNGLPLYDGSYGNTFEQAALLQLTTARPRPSPPATDHVLVFLSSNLYGIEVTTLKYNIDKFSIVRNSSMYPPIDPICAIFQSLGQVAFGDDTIRGVNSG